MLNVVQTPLGKQELLERAARAWWRYCREHGYVQEAPSSSLSKVYKVRGRQRVYLRNVRTDMARYELRGNRLVLLK